MYCNAKRQRCQSNRAKKNCNCGFNFMSFNGLKMTHLVVETCSRVTRLYNTINNCEDGYW